MQDKDFLSQFSTNNKPDSFKEEERIPVAKNNKKLNPKILIGIIAGIIVILVVLFFIFIMPHIEVINFEGQAKEDATAWLKQQEIETTGIVFKEEYNFDIAKGNIISQDPNEGKVTKKAKITFVISNGPDPDEKISVPDFSSMDKEDISSWISTNKLLSTKINTAYDSTIPADSFIEAKYTGCDEDSFTRACTLKISISKGPKPEDEIVMANFVKKTYAEFESWANSKKLNLNKTETYSDTIDTGLVIAQSVKENEKVKVGDTINVTVSKGKGIKVPDFTKMIDSEVDDWIAENTLYCKVKKKYSNSEAYVLEQSVKTGSYIGSDNTLKVTLNLGDSFYLSDIGIAIENNYYDRFKEYAENKLYEEKGLEIDTHKEYVYSNEPKGTIIGVADIYSGSTHYSIAQKLPLSVDIRVTVSNGDGASGNNDNIVIFENKDFINGKIGYLLNTASESDLIFKIKTSDGVQDISSSDYEKTINNLYIDNETTPMNNNETYYLAKGTTIYIEIAQN